MAATFKIVRRTTKKIQKEVTNYFGFPVRAKVGFGEHIYSQTFKKGNKTRGVITLDKQLKRQRISKDFLNRILRHELFHIAGDSFTLKNASATFSATNEAIAMISNAEKSMKKTKGITSREEYLKSLEFTLKFNPPRDEVHLDGMIIMYNIIKKFPDSKLRQNHVKYLLKQNSDALKALQERKAKFLGVTNLGEIQFKLI